MLGQVYDLTVAEARTLASRLPSQTVIRMGDHRFMLGRELGQAVRAALQDALARPESDVVADSYDTGYRAGYEATGILPREVI